MTTSKIGVVIGRFQPFHEGHETLIKKALSECSFVIVLVGDTGGPRTYANPFTFEERRWMIENSLLCAGLIVCKVLDNPYDDVAWVGDVRRIVGSIASRYECAPVLYGFEKDHTGSYLHWFPEWTLQNVEPTTDLSATDIRAFLINSHGDIAGKLFDQVVKGHITTQTAKVIGDLSLANFEALVKERKAIDRFNAEWDCLATEKYGYPVQCAVDALVMTADKRVLLVERAGGVGNGQLALPGGFINPGERLLSAAYRELREETGLDLLKVHHSTRHRNVVFDHPSRSMRGRIVTHVNMFLIDEAVAVAGGDDAKTAAWYEVDKLDRSRMFADHWHIINQLTHGEKA